MKARNRYKEWRRSGSLTARSPPEAVASLHQVTFYKRGKTRQGFARAKTPMPEHFCLVENHEPVAEFLGELRHNLTVAGTKLEKLRAEGNYRKRASRNHLVADNYVDFTTLKHITPASAQIVSPGVV
jgi:hypothetical protein